MWVIPSSLECLDLGSVCCNLCRSTTTSTVAKRHIHWSFGCDLVSRSVFLCDGCMETHARQMVDRYDTEDAASLDTPLLPPIILSVPVCPNCECRSSPVLNRFGLCTMTCLTCTSLEYSELHSQCTVCHRVVAITSECKSERVCVCTSCRKARNAEDRQWNVCNYGNVGVPCTKRPTYGAPGSCVPVTCKDHYFVDVHVWYRNLMCKRCASQSRCCFGDRRAIFPTRCSLCLLDHHVDLTDTHIYFEKGFLRNTGEHLSFTRNSTQWRIATQAVGLFVNVVVLGRPSLPVRHMKNLYISEKVNSLIFLDPYHAPAIAQIAPPDRRDIVLKRLETLLHQNRSFHNSMPRVYYIGRKQKNETTSLISGHKLYEFFDEISVRKRKQCPT